MWEPVRGPAPVRGWVQDWVLVRQGPERVQGPQEPVLGPALGQAWVLARRERQVKVRGLGRAHRG